MGIIDSALGLHLHNNPQLRPVPLIIEARTPIMTDSIKDFGDYADCVEYRNQRESGFGGDEGDWFHGDDATLTIYTGTFGNDHSPGADAYTYHDVYETKAEYDARLAELDALPEYLDSEDDSDDDA